MVFSSTSGTLRLSVLAVFLVMLLDEPSTASVFGRSRAKRASLADDYECVYPDGLFADPETCRRFYICSAGTPYSQTCPPSLYFDDVKKFCTFKNKELTCGPVDTTTTAKPPPDLEAAPKCDPTVCVLPECWCSPDGTLIPGGLEPKDIPQMILMSFDGAMNQMNYPQYRSLLNKEHRKNPNGCPIKATFFVSHEYTSYFYVQKMFADGHEMASNSVSHKGPESWWAKAKYENWTEEMVGMREILNRFGNVSKDTILGMRAPYLKPGGNEMLNMIYDFAFAYDSSFAAPPSKVPLWPYTLDYRVPHHCVNKGCATHAYPGVWEIPLNTMYGEDGTGGQCVLADQCVFPADDEDTVFEFLLENFLRHYRTNRAPLGLYFHVNWFTDKMKTKALHRFVDHVLKNYDNAWFVTMQQALLWMRSPKRTAELREFDAWGCVKREPSCNIPTTCALQFGDTDNYGDLRYMETCTACPARYPWIGNYAGSYKGKMIMDQVADEEGRSPPSSTSASSESFEDSHNSTSAI
ncbi:chitin deacetylase 1 [Ixodes scapularis]|uniref:Putative chitin binding peritrophin-a domain protein n=1 Tax=Ixodes scapularis TaxID=6945 RepID=A0A4D5RRW5_IXOSC|nr:chitin deacetylase 1 [Ixodes scapularis]